MIKKDWFGRILMSGAAANMAVDALRRGLESSMPDYVASSQYELPWWLMVIAAAGWAYMTVHVLVRGVE